MQALEKIEREFRSYRIITNVLVFICLAGGLSLGFMAGVSIQKNAAQEACNHEP